MTPHSDLPDLEQQRSRLHAGLAAVGDFRPGSLSAVMRRCGKPTCVCADPAHPGHGPQHILTKKVAGKTVAVHLKPGTELEKVTGEVANYKLFKQIVGEIVEVSEAICGARRVVPLADDGQPPTQPAGEGGVFSQLQAQFAAEVARLAELAAGSLDDRGGQGLAAVELAIRTAMSKLGASLLQDLLGLDTGHRGPRVDCGAGHQASFVAYRDKNLDTVLGPVTLGRAYYHCSDCGAGVVPKDNELGVANASLSPGLRAMVARVGAAAPFAKASDLLTELAGVELSTKRVERSAEADVTTLVAIGDAEAAAVLTGRLVPLGPAEPVAKLYVAMDGTGVPTVPADTAERAGKYPDGRARTREVKLGVLFTQTSVDDTGHPVRDPGSSSYVATLAPVEHFGSLVYAEARRRGCAQASAVVVLGDGAPWIWNLASQHFTGASQIVDLYHAREHCHALGALVAPALGQDGPGWLTERLAELDRGNVPALLAAGRILDLPDAKTREVDKALGYFVTNAERIRYAHFRELGHFVGSGAVEAGCKAVVGQRLKLSGMRWSVRGAAGLVTLRCQEASDR